MSGTEVTEPTLARMPKNFPEAIKALQTCIRKGGEMDERRQEQISRQKETITRLLARDQKFSEWCRKNGFDYSEIVDG